MDDVRIMRLSSHKLQRERKVELAMTSMIDMTFLLLIYSMTALGVARTERNLESAIKSKQRSARSAPSHFEPAVVEVVRSRGRFVYRVGSREMVSQQELTNLLVQFPNKLDGVFVRVSDEAPFRMAASAIQASKDAGFLSVAYVPSE